MNAPRRLAAGTLAVLLTFLLTAHGGAPPAAKSASKTAPKSAAKTVPKAGSSAKKTTAKGSSRRARTRRTVYRPVQAAPTPERIKEIQQALVERGYESPVDGVWGKASVAAMAQFQKDQKIEATGKLTSMSLIALGLGPRQEPAAPQPGPEKD